MTACVFSTRTDSDGYLHFSTVFQISNQLFHTSFMHSSWRTPMRNSWINLGQNHDQRVSKFKRSGQRIWHAEKSSNQESTNKQQRSFESNLPSSDRKHNDGPCRRANHDVLSGTGEKRMRTLEEWACAQLGTEIQERMRTTGHRNSKTHAHTGTVRICVVMTTHGRDVHALPSLGPNVRRRRTGCVNRYRLQRCGPRSMGKIGQRTKNTQQTGRVKGLVWDEWSRALGLTHWPGYRTQRLVSSKCRARKIRAHSRILRLEREVLRPENLV